jgi:hypothetical protein
MTLSIVFPALALLGSLMLLSNKEVRPYAVVGAIAAAAELALAMGWLHISIAGLPMGTVLGGALAVVGVFSFMKVTDRNAVAAATSVLIVGALQLATGLGLVG